MFYRRTWINLTFTRHSSKYAINSCKMERYCSLWRGIDPARTIEICEFQHTTMTSIWALNYCTPASGIVQLHEIQFPKRILAELKRFIHANSWNIASQRKLNTHIMNTQYFSSIQRSSPRALIRDTFVVTENYSKITHYSVYCGYYLVT